MKAEASIWKGLTVR